MWRRCSAALTREEEVALTANIKLTREEEVALYGEHIRLKAFYPKYGRTPYLLKTIYFYANEKT